jgi:hypothetical protein
VTVDYGQERATQKWLSPQQRAWGLSPHQKLTPGLAEKLCFTAIATTSYASAAAVAARWGVAVDDAVIHQQVQRAGERAEQQAQARTAASATLAAASPPAVSPDALVIMMDGWLLRHRGTDWGRKPAEAAGERVAWQECKSAVIYHLRHAAKTAGERGLLVEKFVVTHVGEPLEFGRRVQAEARRRGLGEAPQVFVVADGGVWIWNLVADRFAAATGVLDFYHASQHLWDLAHTLHPDNETGARARVEPLLHQLRHGGEAGVRATRASRAPDQDARNQLLHGTSGASPLCGARGGRLSHRQRRDGILVRATPRPVQTGRPVLDGTRPSPPHGPRSRPS